MTSVGATRPYSPQRKTMADDLHYFMFFVGRLFQGAEMMIKHSEYIEADENNLMYDFVAAREATREALKEVKEFLEKMAAKEGAADPKMRFDANR
jgi:ATP-dependent RNA circularization protein (DNA/RNA ligase family)